MDATVAAALIAIPTAVIASAAAYAAGRAQARGAHRGPIDAVRRQHQREAYAALVAESQRYAGRMFMVFRAITDLSEASAPNPSLGVEDAEPLAFAVAAVRLEGPPHLASMAVDIQRAANRIFGSLLGLRGAQDPVLAPEHLQFNEGFDRLAQATEAFVSAASVHLNGHP